MSVTDTRSTTPAERAARQAQAEAFATDMRLRAEQLDGADAKVAGQLTAAAGGVGSVGFAQNPTSNPVAQTPGVGRNGAQSPPPTTNHNGVQLVDFTQNNPTGPNPRDSLRGTPVMGHRHRRPSLGSSRYQQSIAAPPAPSPGPPAIPLPSPATTPLPRPAAGPATAAAAKPPCSVYDATKALLEPVGGTVAILTAAPEGATGVGIPAALAQIALVRRRSLTAWTPRASAWGIDVADSTHWNDWHAECLTRQ